MLVCCATSSLTLCPLCTPSPHPQFVDLCILCGCDYCDSIRGIGPKKALKLIKAHGTIEKSIAALDKTKFTIPENFDYARVRLFFGVPQPGC